MGIENPGAGADASAAGAARPDGSANPGGTPNPGTADAGKGGTDTVDYWKSEAKKAFEARDGARKAFLESEEGKKLLAAQQQIEEHARKQALEVEEAAKKRGEFEKLYGEAKTKAEQAEARIAELEAKHKSDVEGLTRKQKAGRARDALETAYRAVGGVDPEAFLILTAKAIDDGDVKVDDDGKVTGVEAVVKKHQDARPHLFGKAPAREGGTKKRTEAVAKPQTKGGMAAVRAAWQERREKARR